jgi:DNA-binding winged helix-turn-helix (wHTH) protein
MFDEAFPTIHQSQEAVSEPVAEIEYIGVPEPAAMPARRAISFGPFRLLPTQQLLLRAGRRVHLGSRALEILIALVGRPGELIGKAELMARVWPDTVVEEGNLKVQVAGLRRALGDRRGGDRYLATIPGRGYRFVAPVTLTEELSDADAPIVPRSAVGSTNFPSPSKSPPLVSTPSWCAASPSMWVLACGC